MIKAIIIAILTGLCWTSFGIILSFTARNKRDVVLFGIVQNFCCFVSALLFFVKWNNFDWIQTVRFIPLILSGGILNAIGQYTTNRAMQKGHNAIVWAISQSSMIVPFIVAAVCFHQSGSWQQWVGVLLILSGIILPNLPQAGKNTRWLLVALAAFLLFGLVQTCYLLPTFFKLSDPVNIRPAAAALGAVLGWSMTAVVTKHRFEVQKSLIIAACGMSLISTVSLVLFFLALDQLARYDLSNIAIPLMVGSNIFAFVLFSMLTIREKCSWKEFSTLAALLAGLVMLTWI